jgi:hypothetical protein
MRPINVFFWLWVLHGFVSEGTTTAAEVLYDGQSDSGVRSRPKRENPRRAI